MTTSAHKTPKRCRRLLTDWVEGSAYQVGDVVLVVARGGDVRMVERFLGMIGTVEELDYRNICGQRYPRDPMVCVRFADGDRDGFWSEELLPIAMRVPAQLCMPWRLARRYPKKLWSGSLFTFWYPGEQPPRRAILKIVRAGSASTGR